ncbi:MAG TPA: carbohydrate ABC transporter permease [Candidatus Bathyarchaeia archaeon]|nr:carbohydrate ABC transporter permease [Candidatus Bathyarchaeia archaeon]
MSQSNPLLRWLSLLGLLVVAAGEVGPYLWMVATSLKDLPDVTTFPPTLIPHAPRWDNYARAWGSAPFLRYLVNNAVQTLAIVLLQLAFACPAAYAFAKLRFPGRDLCFVVVMACLIVPPQVRFVPLYILFSHLGLVNTYAALVLPYSVSALGTFLIREAFMQISDDIVDAARVDGAGPFTIIFRLLVPIARPTVVAFALFSVVYHWNDFFWPLVMTTTDAVRTLPVGVAMLREEGTGARWHIIMAGSMFVVAPMLAVFAVSQRQIVRAFTFASLK